MKAYKVFNSDWTCKDFKYEIGKTYKLQDSSKKIIEPILCEKGFHACEKVSNCFNYYDFNPNNKVAEVELSGTILGLDTDKQCSNIIKIIKEITWEEMLKLANSGIGNSGNSNSGNRNSGDRNSGNSNSGYRNSGYSNSGNSNSGYRNSGYSNSGDSNSGNSNSGNSNSGYSNSGNSNSGDFNSCDYETGFFNSNQSEIINVFNKPCKRSIWNNSNKPDFIYFDLNIWISFDNMTEKEKIKYPKAFVCNGYLKTLDYKEAWQNACLNASKKEIELLKALPNFDADVFEEITGVKV